MVLITSLIIEGYQQSTIFQQRSTAMLTPSGDNAVYLRMMAFISSIVLAILISSDN